MIGVVLLYRAEMISQLIGELVNRDFGETFVNRLTIEVKFEVKLPNFSHLKTFKDVTMGSWKSLCGFSLLCILNKLNNQSISRFLDVFTHDCYRELSRTLPGRAVCVNANVESFGANINQT